jgi:iron-sulfur cluster repair protein YtfE (RIC family)
MRDDVLLTEDHVELDGLLDEVMSSLDAADDLSAFRKLDLFWARLAMHIRAEHLHLFPSILANFPDNSSNTSGVAGKLELLRHDHDFFMRELAEAVRSFREISAETSQSTRTEVGEQLSRLRARLEKHNRIEEAEIYPLLADLKAHVDSDDLAALMKRELDNLPRRFRTDAPE